MLHKYNYKKFIYLITFLTLLISCSKKDQEKKEVFEPNVDKRARAAVDKGGITIFGDRTGSGGSGSNVKFANANVMWKATLQAMEEIPLSQIDYSGGIIITDWYGNSNNTEKSKQIKITVRFLSDELSSSSLQIINHQKICEQNKCTTTLGGNLLNDEIKEKIIISARNLSLQDKKKNNKQ